MQVTERHLRYFTNEEFVREGRNWLPMYNPKLLILLDVFRHLTGPCILSPHPLALGRINYPKNRGSYHIYDAEDGVRAIDVFPGQYANPSISEREKVENWIGHATKIGFTGIGCYPEWTLNGETRIGLHLDIRSEFTQWGYVDGEMVSIDEALNSLSKETGRSFGI